MSNTVKRTSLDDEPDTVFYPLFDGAFLNCPLEFECDADWHDLTQTEHQNVRHCAKCDKDVHFCTDQVELDARASKGHCVAFYESRPHPYKNRTPGMRLGLPSHIIKDGIAVRRSLRAFMDSLKSTGGQS